MSWLLINIGTATFDRIRYAITIKMYKAQPPMNQSVRIDMYFVMPMSMIRKLQFHDHCLSAISAQNLDFKIKVVSRNKLRRILQFANL